MTAFLADLIKGPIPEPDHAALRQRWDVGASFTWRFRLPASTFTKEHEEIFMSCVTRDPILSRMDLIYVVDPETN